MSLIDSTYFVKEINIPSSTYSDLTNYITRFEKEILIKLLGRELYDLMIDDLDKDGIPQTQRFIDLIQGKEYGVGSYTIKWDGLINTACFISLIAYYVYYKLVEAKMVKLSTTGTISQKNENSDLVDASQKMSQVWHLLEELYQSTEYPYQSAYYFLKEHESDYPEWVFTQLGNVNAFDI